MKSLTKAKAGSEVIVRKIHATGPIKQRILDMGITKGTSIYIRKFAPLGDPIELTLRGYELTLRKDDAQAIETY